MGLSARRALSSGSRGLRGRWENRYYPSLDPSRASRRRSLALPCSLLRLGRHRPGVRGLREIRAARIRRCGPAASMAFAPVQSCCFRPGSPLGFDIGLPRCSRNRAASFLSWDSYGGGERIAASRHPSPLHRHHASESAPTAIAGGFVAEGATLAARSVLVVSHHLDGFLLRSARGLVASRCRSWGSPRFGLRSALVASEDARSSRSLPSPRRSIRTPRRMFPADSRTASPRPLPPCRFHDFEALLRHRVRYACHRLPDHLRPSFLGFVPPSRSFWTATGSLLPSADELRTAPEPGRSLARADDRSRRATARLAEASPVTGPAPPRWHGGSVRRASSLRSRSRTPHIERPRREARTTSARCGRDPSGDWHPR
jgi:hypothetical protein